MEISGDVTDAGRTDKRQTNNEQGKIVLLSQMDAGWLSFAIWHTHSLGDEGQLQQMLSHQFINVTYCEVLRTNLLRNERETRFFLPRMQLDRGLSTQLGYTLRYF